MSLTTWWRSFRYSGYDRRGNAKYLAGRAADPTATAVEGVPSAVSEEALKLLCDSFGIPKKQMHYLRRDDELMAIYESFTGPRSFDQLEFERLCMALGDLPGGELHPADIVRLKTVEEVIREVATRRGIRLSNSEPQDTKPTLDYHIVQPEERRTRFLEKTNPHATPRSVARSAVLMCICADLFCLISSFTGRPLSWPAFVGLIVVSAIVGVVLEWQLDDGP